MGRAIYVFCLVITGGCVSETTVIGEGISPLACSTEALVLDAPYAGCGEVHVLAPRAVWACDVHDVSGDVIGARAGQWLWLRSAPARTMTLEITASLAGSACDRPCPAVVHSDLRDGFCSCSARAASMTVPTGMTTSLTLPTGDSTVMLESPGEYTVRLCTGPG